MNDGEWLILDVLRNVAGPYSTEEVRSRARRQPNFFVYQSGLGKWTPVDVIPELMGQLTPDQEHAAATIVSSNAARELEHAVDELLGICKGIIADGKVVPNEADYLKIWLEKNRQLTGVWPANVLSHRIASIYADGVVDEEEQGQLAALLSSITGEKPGFEDAIKLVTSVAIDLPEPRVEFEGKSFCLTGRFAYGHGEKCVEAIESRGGTCHEFPNLETDYLVLGALGGKGWEMSNKGKKIEFVVTNPEARTHTAIISEENWTYHL